MTEAPRVVPLGIRQTEQAVDVLVDAFYDYPLMRHLIEPDTTLYDDHLQSLVDLFVRARVSRGDPILAITDDADPIAVATLTLPSGRTPGADWTALRDQVWKKLGDAGREKYEGFGAAWSTFDMDDSHYHINMIGVRQSQQGRGFARLLMEEVHRLSRDDDRSCGVSLSTEFPGNVALYEHMGYAVVGTVHLADGLQTWGFFRPDAAPTAND